MESDADRLQTLETALRDVASHDRGAVPRRIGYVCKAAAGLVLGMVMDRKIDVLPVMTTAAEAGVAAHVIRRRLRIDGQRNDIAQAAATETPTLVEAAERAGWNADDDLHREAILQLLKGALPAEETQPESGIENLTPYPVDAVPDAGAQAADETLTDEELDAHKRLRAHHRTVERSLKSDVRSESSDLARWTALRRQIVDVFAASERLIARDVLREQFGLAAEVEFCEVHRHQTALVALYNKCMRWRNLEALCAMHRQVEHEYRLCVGNVENPTEDDMLRLDQECDLLTMRNIVHRPSQQATDIHKEFLRHSHEMQGMLRAARDRRALYDDTAA